MSESEGNKDGRRPTRASGALERLRSKRLEAERGKQSEGGSIGVSKSEDSQGTATDDRRRSTLSRRKQIRESGESDTEGDIRAGRIGARSPVRKLPSNRKLARSGTNRSLGLNDSVDLDASGMSDNGEPDDEAQKPEEEIFDDELADLVGISQPAHVYPTFILPRSMQTEQEIQPVLSIPHPRPDVGAAVKSLGNDIYSCSMFSSNLNDGLVSEIELLRSGTSKIGKLANLTNGDHTENDRLLAEFGVGEQKDPFGDEESFRHTEDGLFLSSPPILTDVLMVGDSLHEGITRVSRNNLNLARVTQRTLRELKSAIDEEKLRREIIAVDIQSKDRPNRNKPKLSQIPEESAPAQISENKTPRALAPLGLLKQLAVGPVLSVGEDPVIEQLSQPVLPEQQVSYGGELGQWPEGATKEILGPIVARSDSKHVKRSILRIHMHTLHIKSHPLMSSEERLYSALKSSYAKYSLIFEQRATGYLTYRLVALVIGLRKLTEKPELDENDFLALNKIYLDLVDTLPSLIDLREAIDNMSSMMYQLWKDLQDARLKQGFSSTKATFVARKIAVSSGEGSRVADAVDGTSAAGTSGESLRSKRGKGEAIGASLSFTDDSLGHLIEETNDWDKFSSILETIPTLIRRTQDLFIAKQREEDSSALGQPATSEKDKDASPDHPGHSRIRSRQHRSVSEVDTPAVTAAELAAQERLKGMDRDHARTRQSVEANVQGLLKMRGLLPEYVWRLSNDGTATAENLLVIQEQRRRQQINAMQFKAEVHINGKLMTTSHRVSLDFASMQVDFRQYFELRVLNQPRDISIHLYMRDMGVCFGRDIYLGSVSISTPGASIGNSTSVSRASGSAAVTGPNNGVTHSFSPVAGWFDFSSLDIDGSGAGYFFGQSNASSARPRIEGSILCSTEYLAASGEYYHRPNTNVYQGIRTEDLAVMPHAPSNNNSWTYGIGLVDFVRERDYQSLMPHLNEIDINDPNNQSILDAKARAPKILDSNVFQLSGLDFAVPFKEDGISYQNYIKYQVNLRMQLLLLRQSHPNLFSEPIPLSDVAIQTSELYKQMIAKHCPSIALDIVGDNSAEEAPVETAFFEEASKQRLTNFLDRVRSSQTAQQRQLRKTVVSTTSLVAEIPYYQPLQFEELDLSFLEPKRGLKPKPKARVASKMHVDKVNLLVQVVGARNIPLRSDGAENSAGKKGSSGVSKKEPRIDASAVDEWLDENKSSENRRIRTIVEVKFQENSLSTTSVSGGAPLWKQSLSFPFRAPQDDLTPKNLEQVRDVVTFTLFDEIIEDDAKIGGFLEGEETQRVDKRFLGSFTIPFVTIFREKRIEGIFRVDMPVFNFGYEHKASFSTSRHERSAFEENVDITNRVPRNWWTFEGIGANISDFFERRRLAEERRQMELRDNSFLIHKETQVELEYFASAENSTFIKVLVTLDPLLICGEPPKPEISPATLHPLDRSLAAYAQSWLTNLESIGTHTKHRPYTIFGSNSEGLNVLIPRFLMPMKPPSGFSSRRSLIHLVKQFPYIADVQSFVGSMDLWCTVKQTFDICAGDEEEHAVMLYNFLYYQFLTHASNSSTGHAEKLKAAMKGHPTDEFIQNESLFLVLGNAIPEGDTVYVMMRDSRKKVESRFSAEGFLLINPTTGHVYSAQDDTNPLRDIYCLATPYNIWANIQPATRPTDVKYDLMNIEEWRPFFGSRCPVPHGGLHSIQEEMIYNTISAESHAAEVEKYIRQAVKTNIRRWRSKRHRSTTSFHPDACSIMNDILPSLENWSRYGTANKQDGESGNTRSSGSRDSVLKVLQDEVASKMSAILRTRVLRGCPVNIPFLDIEDAMEKIKSLRIHENKHPEVQFVMAVRAFPIAGTLISLWVFVGTLENISH